MRKTAVWILTACILLIPVHMSAWGSEENGKGAPSILVQNPEYQFGSSPEGVELVHDFIIKNAGTAPLHITKVKTG
jgi:hypothetical protein